ncbi:uncharacterized protein LOC103516113, partial [Diaphorina citri]|uniref:Uncharacterized protein LOC103516113 n=1 Tax=Diaphorina citri TaxID=121845 RepID=A0A3Q0JCG0_DIACI
MDVDDADLREQIFNNTVREKVIFLLVFLLLNVLSYILIEKFKRKDLEDYLSTDEDEATVYTVSVCLCSVSLSVSLGAALLLPFSIASNEVLNLYPHSFYIQWLNHSLVQGLWNNVFLFSNVSMFILLPFSYLFTESEGLYCRKVSSSKPSLHSSKPSLHSSKPSLHSSKPSLHSSKPSLHSSKPSLHSSQPSLHSSKPSLHSSQPSLHSSKPSLHPSKPSLHSSKPSLHSSKPSLHSSKPRLHSMETNDTVQHLINLLAKTPMKINETVQHLTTLPHNVFIDLLVMIVKTNETVQHFTNLLVKNSNGDMKQAVQQLKIILFLILRLTRAKATGKSYLQPPPMMVLKNSDEINDESELLHLVNGALQSGLGEKLTQVRRKKHILDTQRQSSPLQRNLVYPAAMILLLVLTVITVLLVVSNSLGLLIGINALPLSTQ